MKRGVPQGQMTLLDWTPPAPVQRFAEERVRAQTLGQRISRAVGAALRDADDHGMDRDEIAQRMSEFLGERVSRTALDGYASQAREDRAITLVRFVALIHATRDQRLLEMLAEGMGWAVVERRFLTLIELAAVRDHADELLRRAKAIQRQARAEGAL